MPLNDRAYDYDLGATTPLGAPPAKTDLSLTGDVSNNNLPRTTTKEQDACVITDASVSNQASPGGTHRIPIVNPTGPALEYVTWTQVAAASGDASPGPLRHTGWLSGTQYVNEPRIPQEVTTLWLNPDGGSIMHYNGSSWDPIDFPSPVSLSLSGKTAGIYDIFSYVNAGAVALEFSTVWTGDFRTRANAVSLQNGVPVKDSDKTRRLVGLCVVHATGTTRQGGASPLIIPVQYMWNAEEPHSWYGRYCGWMAPWGLCQFLGNGWRTRPLAAIHATTKSGARAVGFGRAKGWCFRYPNRCLVMQGSRVDVQAPGNWQNNYYTGSSANDINLNTVSGIGTLGNNVVDYDPSRDKFWCADFTNNDFYKFGIGGSGSSATGSTTDYLYDPVWCPTQDKLFGHHRTSTYLVTSFSLSAETFGTGIAATGFGGYSYIRNAATCYCPVNDRIYAWTSSNTIKVINPSTEAVVATITPSITPYNSDSYYAAHFLEYIPTLRKVVAVCQRNTNGCIMAIVIDPNTNTEDFTAVEVNSGNSGRTMENAQYVPGWDVILVGNSNHYFTWIDCRTLAHNDSTVPFLMHYLDNTLLREAQDYYNLGLWWPGDNQLKCEVGADLGAGTPQRRTYSPVF